MVLFHGAPANLASRIDREGLHAGLGRTYRRGVDLSADRRIAADYARYHDYARRAESLDVEVTAARRSGQPWSPDRADAALERLRGESVGLVVHVALSDDEADEILAERCGRCGGHCPAVELIEAGEIVCVERVPYTVGARERIEAFIGAYMDAVTRPRTAAQSSELWERVSAQ